MQHKQIYEIDRIVVQQKFEQMQSFISIGRNFSVKIHGHLKILCHLVNNLIDSEDNLELVDSLLKMPTFAQESHTVSKTTIRKNINEENIDEEQNKGMNQLYSVLKTEHNKIQEQFQKGEQNTNFLKEMFNKMFEQIQNQQNQGDQKQRIINQIECAHDGPQNIYTNNPQINKKNPIQSVYIPIERKREKRRSVTSLKDEINDMKNEIRQIRKIKQPEDEGINDLLQKLLKQKNDFDEEQRRNEKIIKNLKKELQESKLNIDELKQSIKILIVNNRTLEEIVREKLKLIQEQPDFKLEKQLLVNEKNKLQDKNQQLKSDKNHLNYEIERLKQQCQQQSKKINENIDLDNEKEMLAKENKKLQNKLQDLQNQNEFLSRKTQDYNKQSHNGPYNFSSDQPKYNHSDFLKCMYAQAVHIEGKQKGVIDRRSYQSFT